MSIYKSFGWLPEAKRAAILDESLTAYRAGAHVTFNFYKGVISNFYRANFMLNTELLTKWNGFMHHPIHRPVNRQLMECYQRMVDSVGPDIMFNCGEQMIMAFKASLCQDHAQFVKIMAESDPQKIKNLGRGVSNYNQNDAAWKKLRIAVLTLIIYLRKEQQPEFARACDKVYNIVSQDESIHYFVVVEVSPFDPIWGVKMDDIAFTSMFMENPEAAVYRAQQSVFTQAFQRFFELSGL